MSSINYSANGQGAQPQQAHAQKVPVSQQKSPVAVAIATAVRYDPELKQRQGINVSNGQTSDFFRYKRFLRALEGDNYKKQSAKKPELLPEIPDDATAQKVFVMLIQNQLILPVKKLKTKVAQDRGVKVTKTTPALQVTNKAVLQPDEYYMWNFTPPNPYLFLYSILGLVGIFTVVLFPLWPIWMRRGVWYISTGLLGFIGVFFAIAIIRLIIYVVTWVALPQQFWLFPNLFADCGVIESFQPVYGWEDPKQQKGKKKKAAATSAATAAKPASKPAATKPTAALPTTEKVASTNGSTGAKPASTKTKKRTATVEAVEEE